MYSLNAHLRAGDSHDGLPFHAGCPICRESRLQGTLVLPALVPVRAQAAVVAGAVALSSAGLPMAALAAEQDQTSEGAAQVTQVAQSDPAVNADFDPGGSETSLPDQPDPVSAPASTPAPEVAADNAPAAAATQTTDTDDPVVDAGDDAPEAARPPRTPAPVVVPPAPVAAAPIPALAPAPAGEGVPVPLPTAAVPAVDAAPTIATVVPTPVVPKASRKRAAKRAADKPRPTQVGRTRAPRAATSPVVAAAAPAMPAAPRLGAAPTARLALASDDRTHIVRPGESLWAIAAALVGDDASPAAIAREVNHLWSLNSQRIGTGDPDLLNVGTRLRLR